MGGRGRKRDGEERGRDGGVERVGGRERKKEKEIEEAERERDRQREREGEGDS